MDILINLLSTGTQARVPEKGGELLPEDGAVGFADLMKLGGQVEELQSSVVDASEGAAEVADPEVHTQSEEGEGRVFAAPDDQVRESVLVSEPLVTEISEPIATLSDVSIEQDPVAVPVSARPELLAGGSKTTDKQPLDGKPVVPSSKQGAASSVVHSTPDDTLLQRRTSDAVDEGTTQFAAADAIAGGRGISSEVPSIADPVAVRSASVEQRNPTAALADRTVRGTTHASDVVQSQTPRGSLADLPVTPPGQDASNGTPRAESQVSSRNEIALLAQETPKSVPATLLAELRPDLPVVANRPVVPIPKDREPGTMALRKQARNVEPEEMAPNSKAGSIAGSLTTTPTPATAETAPTTPPAFVPITTFRSEIFGRDRSALRELSIDAPHGLFGATDHSGGGSRAVAPDAGRAEQMTTRSIVNQVVQSALRVAGEGSVEVRLQPEELGRVRLTLLPTEAGVSVQVTAERAETLELLRRNIDMLESDLRRQGFMDASFSFGSEHSDRADTDADEPATSGEERDAAGQNVKIQVQLTEPSNVVDDGRLDIRV